MQIGCEGGGKGLLAALARNTQGPADQGAGLDCLGNLLHLAAAQAGDAARDALNGGLQGPGGRAEGQGLPGCRPLRFGLAGRVARRLEAEQRPAHVLPAGNRLGGVEPLPCCGHGLGRADTGEHLHDGLSDASYILRPLTGAVSLTDALLIVPRDAVLQEGVGVPPGPLRYRIGSQATKRTNPLHSLIEAAADEVRNALTCTEQGGGRPLATIQERGALHAHPTRQEAPLSRFGQGQGFPLALRQRGGRRGFYRPLRRSAPRAAPLRKPASVFSRRKLGHVFTPAIIRRPIFLIDFPPRRLCLSPKKFT